MKLHLYVSILCLTLLAALPGHAQLDESKLTWKPDRGISLNGYSDFYQVEADPEFDLFQLTVEGWVRFRDNSGQQQLLGRGGASQYFTHYANNGNYRFLVENVEVGYDFAESPVPPADTWVHIAGTYDENTIRMYYNGILVDETEYPGITRGGDDPIMIGAMLPGQRHLNGLIENLRIWNRALSEEEITTLLSTSPGDENITQMVSDGLIAYWSSSAMSNDTLEDLAGDHDAIRQVFTLDETYLTFKPEAGINFDGKSTYIKVEDMQDFNVPAFSTEVWVRFDATHENQVFMNRGGAPTDFTFYLYDRVRFLVQDSPSYSHANGIVPPSQTWVHIVGTLSEDGTKRLYYNGILQHEMQGPPNPITSNNPLYIGALEPGSRHLDGQMENMRFWNKTLTVEEIRALLQTPPNQENIEELKNMGLVAYWALSSVEGNVVRDLSGNGHDGQMSAFTIDQSHLTFTPGQGILFNGTNTFAMIEDSSPFDLDYVTVEAWVKVAPIFHDRTLSQRGIVSRGGAAESFSLYAWSQYGNKLHMQVGPFGDSTAPMPPANEWIHIAGTYNENTLNLFYNGVPVDSINAPGILDWPVSPVYIGALSQTGGYFEGAMDYIRIWNRALSEEEIQAGLATPPAEENITEMNQNGLIAYYASSAVEATQLTDLSGNGNNAVFTGQVVAVDQWELY